MQCLEAGLHPDWRSGPEKVQMTTDIIPSNTYLAKVAVKSAPGVPDVEALPLEVPEHDLLISGSYSLISGKVPTSRCSA